MTKEMHELINDNLEARVFDFFRRGKSIPWYWLLGIAFKSFFRDTFYWFIKSWPGSVGMQIRNIYFKCNFKSMGMHCLIEEGIRVEGARNISISDYVFIDRNTSLFARFGYIEIGRRVHVAPYAYISGGGGYL